MKIIFGNNIRCLDYGMLKTLWTGSVSTVSDITFTESIKNFNAILVTAYMYSNVNQQMMGVIYPGSNSYSSTTAAKTDLCINASTKDTAERRVICGFTTDKTLSINTLEGTASHKPIVCGIYGIGRIV